MDFTSSAAAAAPLDQFTELDRWFEAIDHQQIVSGRSSWTAEVVGIHSSNGELWVQVSPTEWPGSAVVLRVTHGSSVDCALAALAECCEWPVTSLKVIDLRPDAPQAREIAARQARCTHDSSPRALPYTTRDRRLRATPTLKLRSRQTRPRH